MANEMHHTSLPVVSEDIMVEIKAAFVRIEGVPVAATLIDQISKELWVSCEDECSIEAGSSQEDPELENYDQDHIMIA